MTKSARRRPTVSRPSRGRHPRQDSTREGARTDAIWVRHGAGAFRRDLTNVELLRAIQWVHSRARKRKEGLQRWTDRDQATTDETKARAWAFGEIQGLRYQRQPMWLDAMDLPARRQAQYSIFLGYLILAHRAGAVGVVLSYEEAMSLLGVGGRSTWRRWCVEMEDLGLLRIVQMWKLDDKGKPCFDRLLYRIGPRLEDEGGPALLEDADEPRDGALNRWRRHMAIGLRRRAKERRKEIKARLWQTCRGSRVQQEQAPAAAQEPQAPTQRPDAAAQVSAEEPAAPLHRALEEFDAEVRRLSQPPQMATERRSDAESQASNHENVSHEDRSPEANTVFDLRQFHNRTPLYPLSGAHHAGPPRGPVNNRRHGRLTAAPLPETLPTPSSSRHDPGLPTPHGSDVGRGGADSNGSESSEHPRPAGRSTHANDTDPTRVRGHAKRPLELVHTASSKTSCPDCGGGGGVGPIPCSTCDGEGSLDGGIDDDPPGACRTCRGFFDECPECGGTNIGAAGDHGPDVGDADDDYDDWW